MRKCHNNTCPVGVATQDPELRKHFKGKPEHVINYFRFIAMELREIMASLGIKTLNEMVGRVDLLEVDNNNRTWKTKDVDLSSILYKPELPSRFGHRKTENQADQTIGVLDRKLIDLAKESLLTRDAVVVEKEVRNIDRSVGTMLSGKIVEIHGKEGLSDDTITINLNGTAGQSFGAFLAPGVTLDLKGDANDYLGKGLSGGKIIVSPHDGAFLAPGVTLDLKGDANDYLGKGLSGGKIIVSPHEHASIEAGNNIIAGNTLLYGATRGEAYISGIVGERFAVRNSGAIAVVEGIGDHGCEYMTGGRIVILGKTGRNFGAGMSGGIAFVYDEDNQFSARCNYELIEVESLNEEDLSFVKNQIEIHAKYTKSAKARTILENWAEQSCLFKKAISPKYREIIKEADAVVESKVG